MESTNEAILTIPWVEFISQSPASFTELCRTFENSPQDTIIDASDQSEMSISENLVAFGTTVAQHQKTLVLIFPAAGELELNSTDWNVVPTQQEAEDFISFERMQRDLGF